MTGVYLASAIDQAHGSAQDLVDIQAWLTSRPEISWVFNPAAAFKSGMGPRDPGIRAINREALDQAGLLVAILPAGVVSIGVPMEIERAVGAGRPTVVISDAPSWMLEFDEAGVCWVPEWGPEAREGITEALARPAGASTQPLPVLLSEGGALPSRGYADDAGLDLIVSRGIEVRPGKFVDVPCDTRVQLPDWSWGLITGRSSTLRKRGLMVSQGVIDSGYRGPLFAGVWNLTDLPVKVDAGDRIAQLILLENATRRVNPVQVQNLDAGSRGEAGFGSTGR